MIHVFKSKKGYYSKFLKKKGTLRLVSQTSYFLDFNDEKNKKFWHTFITSSEIGLARNGFNILVEGKTNGQANKKS